MTETLLDIDNLNVHFHTPEGIVRAVDGVGFQVAAGETVGLVGESGCGKSVTSLSLLGLIPSPPARVSADGITFDGRDIRGLDPGGMRRLRGKDIAIIFQEPMTSLNPVLTIGRQVAEPLMVHKGLSKPAALKEALRWLEQVKIPAASSRLNDYPHQLSGGMRQRVMIAMAMVCRPKLLIADEPTTALDVTIQAQILALMMGLKQQLGMSVLLITHDLGVVAQAASRVVVMYAGQVVEEAPVEALFDQPLHPYTQGLLKSMPKPGIRLNRLNEIKGTVPSLLGEPLGCKFAPRCGQAFDRCLVEPPRLSWAGQGRRVRCWLMEANAGEKTDA